MNIKKTVCRFLLVLIVITLTGCGSSRKDTGDGYRVYYVDEARSRLVEDNYVPSAENFENLLNELLYHMTIPAAGAQSALYNKVAYMGYERGIDALRVDFSEGYYTLTNIQAVLFQAAVVKTLCQIPGVTKIMITVNKEQIRDSDGVSIPAMDANTFIDTQEGGINSYLYAALQLYFPKKNSEELVQELRNYHYSSNMVLERVVMEQLIEGPSDSDFMLLFSKGTKIQNLYTQNGICTVNLDAEANKNPSETSPSPETVLRAVAESICDTCDGITGVRFEIEGDSSGLFRNAADITGVFSPESTIAKTNVNVGIDPSLTKE